MRERGRSLSHSFCTQRALTRLYAVKSPALLNGVLAVLVEEYGKQHDCRPIILSRGESPWRSSLCVRRSVHN